MISSANLFGATAERKLAATPLRAKQSREPQLSMKRGSLHRFYRSGCSEPEVHARLDRVELKVLIDTTIAVAV
uniref:Uncharacterized protein n=1 Tax=Fulvimarina pelagi TaxID=217511 RepID=A0A0P0Z9A5_9HYPH|nr:hypothetical protein [Fulvimarina pelagi]